MKSWCPRPIPRRSSVPAVRHPVNSAAVSPSPSLRLVNNTKCSRQTNIAAHFTVTAVRFIAIRKVALSNEYCFFPFLWPGFTVQFYLRVETIGGIVAAIDIGKKNVSRSPASLDHLSNIIARVRHARRNSIYRYDLEPTSSSRIAFRFARWSAANNLVAIPFTISFFLRTVFRFVRTRRSMECKKVVLRGGHWAAFKVDEDDRPYRPTSSKHNRKFPPITYSPRSNPFLLRFIPSIFPSLFALASSIYPLGKLGHSGMDLSKWKRNLANGRERERERRSYYLSASNPNYKRLATNRVRDHRWGRSFGLFERIACDCLFIPARTFSFFEPAFLSDVYALQRRGALPPRPSKVALPAENKDRRFQLFLLLRGGRTRMAGI